jgi:glycosyltransferase involved in cell wall biosynthesis
VKVLFFSSEFPWPQQPLRAVFNLRMCESLGPRHDVRIVSPIPWTENLSPVSGAAGPLDAVYQRYYYPPRVLLAERGRFMWWSVRHRLLSLARSWQPDVTLAYWAHPDGEVALRLRERLGIPVVQMIGGSDIHVLKRDPRRFERVSRVLRAADAVITVGSHLADEVRALGVAADRVTSIYRPVDAARFSPGSSPSARALLGLAHAPTIVWVGRLHKIKGVDILLHAFANLHARMPGIQLCLVGDGPERQALKTLADGLGVQSAVLFTGDIPQADLCQWYRAGDVVVLPSLSEGVPNVLLEAIACGVPFVASNVGGIGEIADSRCDRLVPPSDADALAAALEDVLSRPSSLRQERTSPGSAATFAATVDRVFERVTGRLAVSGAAV